MRNFTFAALAVAFMGLFGCHHDDDKDVDAATCPTDTATDDTSIDTAVDTADTSVSAGCTDSTGTYALGESWTCPDGCNTCTCTEPDVIASTDMACSDTGTPPDTGASDTGSGGTDTATGR
jgi:hypothetical protein